MSPRVLRIGLIALAALVLLVGGAGLLIHSRPGERLVATLLQDALSAPARRVKIDGFRLGWPLTASATSVRVFNEAGPWLSIDRPELAWDPLALTRRVLRLDRVVAARVVVARLPESGPGGGGAFHIPRLTLRLGEVSAPIVLEAPVLGEPLTLDLGGTAQVRHGGGTVDLHLRAAEGGAVQLIGTAGRDFLDLRWYVQVPRLERWRRLAGVDMAGTLSASGTIAGRLDAPAVTANLDAGPGGVGEVGWERLGASLSAYLQGGRWAGSLVFAAERPRPLDIPSLQVDAAFDLTPETGRLGIERARVEGGGATAFVTGAVDRFGHAADLAVDTGLRDVLALSGLDWRGEGPVRLRLTGDLPALALRATLRTEARAFATGIGMLDRLVGETPTARATLAYDPASGARLVSGLVNGARADAASAGPLGNLAVTVALRDLSALTSTLAGQAVVRARLEGRPLGASGTARVEDLRVAGLPPASGTLGFRVADLAGSPAGPVSADLRVEGRPLTGRAQVSWRQPVRIDHLDVASGDSRVTGDLLVEAAGVRGRLSGTVPHLAQWRPGTDGSLQADVALEPGRARVTAEARALVAAGVSAADARLSADATLGPVPTGRARLVAHGIGGVVPLAELQAEADGSLKAFRFSLAGDRGLASTGSGRIEGPRGGIAIDRLRFAELSLSAPSRLLWGPDGARVDPLTLAVAGGGSLSGQGQVVRGRVAGRAELTEVPADLVEQVVPGLDVSGRVSGRVLASGTADHPEVTFDLAGRDMGVAAAARSGLGRLAVTAKGQWRDGRLEGTASAGESGRIRLMASGSLPLPVTDGPVTGRVEVAGDLERLTEAFPLGDHAVAGRLDGQARIGGTVRDPLLDGTFRLSGGRYENLEHGTLVENLSAHGRLDGALAEVTAAGNDGRRGSVALNGTVTFGEVPSWRAHLAAERFQAVRRDDLRAVASGGLDIVGTGGEGRVTGTLAVQRAEFDISRLQGEGPAKLDVVEINGPPRPPTQARPRASVPLKLGLGIDLAIERAFVRGRGLDSEWSGKLAVGGTADKPELTGKLVVERGTFDFAGRSFRLTEDSAVLFTGQGIDPTLAVAAEAKAGDITARVDAKGSGSHPDLQFSSQPPLPRDEVLSRVLFGKEAGALSVGQQIGLGQLAASGLGGGGFDPVGSLRGALGLDVLSVGSGEGSSQGTASAPTLSAGKYIGQDTYLRVEQGTTGLGKVTVEREIGRGFSITTGVGQESGGGVGFEWRRDY